MTFPQEVSRISQAVVYAPDHLRNASLEETLNWLRDIRISLEEQLLELGYILFKGFTTVRNEEDFSRFSSIFSTDFMNNKGGISPRSKVCDNVMISTDLDRHLPIQLHQEFSYQTNYPDKVAFFCKIAPRVGGETPIVDMRKVYAALPKSLLNRFEHNQLRIKRIFPLRHEKSRFIKSWQATFLTNSLDELEAIVQCQGGKLNIKNSYVEVINQVTPAVITHPITQEKIWFNQAHLFHSSTLSYWARKYRTWYFWLMTLATHLSPPSYYTVCTYSDGTRINTVDLNIVREAIDKNTICNPWCEGDILLLENRIMAHGRRPYKGRRKVVVTLLKDSR